MGIFVDKKADKTKRSLSSREAREREAPLQPRRYYYPHSTNYTTVHTKHTYTTFLYESIYECHAYIYPVFYSIHCLSNVDDVDMIERLFGYLLGEKKTDKEDEKMINGDKK